jgi:ribosome-binding factor A
MTNPRTLARLEARILERAAHCIEFELNDPRIGMITLTRVELSDDLSYAKVHYSTLGGDSRKRLAQAALDSARGFIQRQVGRVLETRKIPHLSFHFDERIELAAEMDLKIRAALERDNQIRPGAHPEDPADPPAESPTGAAAAELDPEIRDEYREFLDAQDEGELDR